MCYRMARHWCSLDHSMDNYEASQLFRRRMRMLWNMHRDSRKHLYENHYNNPDSNFKWLEETIKDYLIPDVDRIPEELTDGDPRFNPEEIAAETESNELLTTEQRMIQWAIANGGAQNL